MYYHNHGKPYIPTKALYRLNEPKRRHHSMLIGYTEGGPVHSRAEHGLTGYVWKVFYKDNNDVVVIREDEPDTEYLITNKAGVTQLDMTFDQNMRPFVVYVADGLPYYFHFNADDSSYSEVALDPTIKFPRCELDYRETHEIPRSDIILGYTRDGNLCYRIQHERFTKENIIATDPKKSMLWRIGRLVDGRFGYQWR